MGVRTATLRSITLVLRPEGLLITAECEFADSGVIVPSGYGAAWLTGLMSAVGIVELCYGRDQPRYACRLRIVGEGQLTGIGHPVADRWFDPRSPAQIASVSLTVARVQRALAHINSHRAKFGRRALNPLAVGWSSDDITSEASRLGWADPV